MYEHFIIIIKTNQFSLHNYHIKIIAQKKYKIQIYPILHIKVLKRNEVLNLQVQTNEKLNGNT